MDSNFDFLRENTAGNLPLAQSFLARLKAEYPSTKHDPQLIYQPWILEAVETFNVTELRPGPASDIERQM